jgi:hypothetical protein
MDRSTNLTYRTDRASFVLKLALQTVDLENRNVELMVT